jgi:hypothetical protein
MNVVDVTLLCSLVGRYQRQVRSTLMVGAAGSSKRYLQCTVLQQPRRQHLNCSMQVMELCREYSLLSVYTELACEMRGLFGDRKFCYHLQDYTAS